MGEEIQEHSNGRQVQLFVFSHCLLAQKPWRVHSCTVPLPRTGRAVSSPWRWPHRASMWAWGRATRGLFPALLVCLGVLEPPSVPECVGVWLGVFVRA